MFQFWDRKDSRDYGGPVRGRVAVLSSNDQFNLTQNLFSDIFGMADEAQRADTFTIQPEVFSHALHDQNLKPMLQENLDGLPVLRQVSRCIPLNQVGAKRYPW